MSNQWVECFRDNSRRQRRLLAALFLMLTISFGLAQIYACRYELTPDAMDYLDIAREVASGHWKAIANGYWGTLNSVLLAPLFVFRPTPAHELQLAHLYGILILIFTFFAFRWFLHTSLDHRGEAISDAKPLPEWAMCCLGYSLFLWSSLGMVGVEEIGPDLLITAFVYLAAAALLHLERGAPVGVFILFGAILGVGYWAKAIMFPVALVFLCISTVKATNWRKNAVSVLAFAVLAGPLLAAISLPRGRFTFGDSGKLNYSSLVSPGGRVINWQGNPEGSGIPAHPTRKIGLEGLPVYEFNGPVDGTYPPSYDPSYWNEGRRVTWNLKAQISVILRHIPSATQLFLVSQPALTAGVIFLLLCRPRAFSRHMLGNWHLLLVSASIVGLYMLVHFETRFAGAFVVLAWFSAFSALRLPANISQKIGGFSVIALALTMMLTLTSEVARKLTNGCHDSALSHLELAQQLNLPPGTPVAVVGRGNYAYWAHFSQLRIVAELMADDEGRFWRAPVNQRKEIYDAFSTTGADWLIARPPDAVADLLEERWKRVGKTEYYRYALHSQGD